MNMNKPLKTALSPDEVPHRVPLNPDAAEARARKEVEMAEQQAAAEPALDPSVPRRVRKPFGSVEAKLKAPKRPGYVRRWFNDSPGRIERAREAGYELVMADDGKRVSHLGGKDDKGEPVMMYLMEIPEEYYREDQDAKRNSLHAINKAVYTGARNQEAGDNTYVPRDIQVGERRGFNR
jgi:hypothetical protein